MAWPQMGFLEFVGKRQRYLGPGEWADGLHKDGRNKFTWRDGKDEYDFSDFFPTDDGRDQVADSEAASYFRYRAWCRKRGFQDEGFEPYPAVPDEENEDG